MYIFKIEINEMLLQILNGSESSQIVLLKDNVDCIDVSNEHLLCNFLVYQSKRYDIVVLLCYEQCPAAYLNVITDELKERIVMIDGTKHSHTWLDLHDFKNSGSDSNIRNLIEEKIPCGVGSLGIVIDSLSFHLLLRPPSFTCQLLHNISMSHIKGYDVRQVVCGVHQDVIDDHVLRLVEHTASSVLTLLPSKQAAYSCVCNTIHHRNSGKIIRTSEQFNVDADITIQDVSQVNSSPDTTETSNKAVDPASNLTFNLTLKENEQEAKDQLILPYIIDSSRKETVLKQPGSGQIFYQADEVDDLDEEDPDDDLNI